MTSLNKKKKVDKRLHWGRVGRFLKTKIKGIKGLDFFNGSMRLKLKNELNNYYE